MCVVDGQEEGLVCLKPRVRSSVYQVFVSGNSLPERVIIFLKFRLYTSNLNLKPSRAKWSGTLLSINLHGSHFSCIRFEFSNVEKPQIR